MNNKSYIKKIGRMSMEGRVMNPRYQPPETPEQKEQREAKEEDAYYNYTCPICGAENTEYDQCGCAQDVNLPKD